MKKLLAILSFLIIAGASAEQKIVVGSKIDTEGGLLGNIIKLVLEDQGFEVVNNIQLGTTQTVRAALINGQIDIYPEYTGNGAFFHNMEDSDIWRDAAKGYETIKTKDQKAFDLAWLRPSTANNTWALAMKRAEAEKQKIISLSDFADYVNQGGRVKLIASQEFVSSNIALPAFQSAYGFMLSDHQLLTLAGGNTAATLRALATAQDNVNVAMAYGTDGALAQLGLVILQDDKNVQPVYAPAAVVRGEILRKYPEIQKPIEEAFMKLNLVILQELNAQIAIHGRAASAVAKSFLIAQDLIQAD